MQSVMPVYCKQFLQQGSCRSLNSLRSAGDFEMSFQGHSKLLENDNFLLKIDHTP